MQQPEIVSQLPRLKPRPADSNKGAFGRVLVVAGSRGMSGAAVLCASAALRGGAGLVRLAVPAEILPIVASANPCYMTAPLPQDEQGRLAEQSAPLLLDLIQANDVIAFGPGLGQGPAITSVLRAILEKAKRPLVLDADGLNALVDHLAALKAIDKPGDSRAQAAASLILTPHPGEFARLLRTDTATVQGNRQELAVRFAREHGVVLVLKGHATIVTDGQRVFHNTTGNPGLATGGTGDVLTGLLAALLGQGLEPFAAAQLGVYVHGLAGDLARFDLGEVSLIASDVLHYLPRAFNTCTG